MAASALDISVIRRFMVLIGPVKSLFDFLTLAALLVVFRFDQAAFQTGWFIEPLATQVLVLFVIRTAGRPLVESTERATGGHGDRRRHVVARGLALHASSDAARDGPATARLSPVRRLVVPSLPRAG
jgi:hypothetical protein